MARMKKQVLGKVSGGVGDLVFRNRNENNYIALKPIRFNTPMDDRAVARRNKFKSAVQLASAMNAIIPLKSVWNKNTTGNNTVYNRMVKSNYSSLVDMLPSQYTLLAPGKGFPVTTQNIELNQEQVRVLFNALGSDSGIDTQIEKTIRMACVLCLSAPSNPMYSEIVYLPLISGSQNIVLTEPLDITIGLNATEKELFNLYGNKKMLAGLITFDVDLQAASSSNTIFFEQ